MTIDVEAMVHGRLRAHGWGDPLVRDPSTKEGWMAAARGYAATYGVADDPDMPTPLHVELAGSSVVVREGLDAGYRFWAGLIVLVSLYADDPELQAQATLLLASGDVTVVWRGR